MTSQKDQIQTLIAEIDKVLQKPSTRLPWVMSGETAQQRRVLERVRSYLVSLQQKMAADEQFSQARTKSNLSTYDIQYQPTQTTDYTQAPIAPIGNSQDAAARQILQAVVHEMEHLRTSLTQPLQADLDALRQQRESLVQEVRQLEAQRQHYSLAQQQANQQKIISEFLQVLMGRLQDSLAQQVAQTLSTLQSQTPYELNPTEPIALRGRADVNQPLLNPGQRLEQLQMLQARSDQLLMNLDSTLSIVFEALQRNVQSYQESLSTGLERMHDLGQQGEVMFTALASHLAQQLGREASSFLHSSLPASELEAGTPTNGETTTQRTSISPVSEVSVPAPRPPLTTPQTPSSQNFSYDSGTLDLPYPGAELRKDRDRSSSPESLPEPLPESLPEVGDDAASLEDFNLEGLNLAGMGLNDAELDSENLDALLDVDLSSPKTDTSSLASGEQPNSPQQSVWPDSSAKTPTDLATSTSELEFLEQLDIALQHQDSEFDLTSADLATSADLSELGELTEGSSSQESGVSGVAAESMLETDDLYASLFGAGNLGTDLEAQVEPESPAIVDMPVTSETSSLARTANVSGAWEEPVDINAEAQPPQTSDLASMSVSDLFAELPETSPEASPEVSLEAAPIANLEPLSVKETAIPPHVAPAAKEAEETLATLEDFLFADATEPRNDENSELSDFALPATAPIPQAPEVALPESDAAGMDLDAFRSSFIDETDDLGDADPLLELADLLGDAEVVPEASSRGMSSPAASDVPTPSRLEAVEDENELLLSELSLQDVPVLGVKDTAQPLDDTYVPAAPEEYLITVDEDLSDETEVSLWLDEAVVQQLDEDLFSLESSDGLFSKNANVGNRAAGNLEDVGLDFAEPLAGNVNQPISRLEQAQAPESQTWDNLTLEDFVETLPETLPTADPAVVAEEPDPSDDLSAFWESADASSTPAEPAADLTLDAFDLLSDLPAIAPPPSAERESPPTTAKTQPLENQLTELDTQSLTIDDAFMGFLEATDQTASQSASQSASQLSNPSPPDSSDRNVAPPDLSNLWPDEKKKI